ncbi:MAG: hypothetical protein HGB00_08360 [Chlorobiaceae bacterium]|nr:hypothetical protein [Chlorobiaceae bacterium]
MRERAEPVAEGRGDRSEQFRLAGARADGVPAGYRRARLTPCPERDPRRKQAMAGARRSIARTARGGCQPLRKVGGWRELRLRAGVAVSRCAGAAAEAAALAAANGEGGRCDEGARTREPRRAWHK